MSLEAMLAAHDDAALEALANKGLVRRATRDLESGLAEVLARDTTRATVAVDGTVVTVTDAGPRPADCPCPATGMCRHLLTAVLALRDGSPAAADKTSARDEVLAMSEAEIIRFAGADLQAALVLATTGAEIAQDGSTLNIALPDMPMPVQFIAGRTLKDAVFKGPAARKRLAVAAAVLALRIQSGQPMELPDSAAPDQPTALAGDVLTDVTAALEQLLVTTLRGGASVCMDRIFDLAISARAQSAPRLTGELRALLAEARLSLERHVAFEPERFAASVARAYALVHALKGAPDDPALLGVLQRDYAQAPPIDALVLGASAWHAPSGARGMRVHCFDRANARWISTGQARAAGQDPTFTPHRAYELSTLGSGNARDLVGHNIRIETPRLSSDGQLAPTTAGKKGRPVSWSDLTDSSALFDDWDAARENLAKRRTRGLRQRETALPILLGPARIRREGFDEFGQMYRLHLIDRVGNTLPLLIPSRDAATAKWLEQVGGKLRAILCTARPQDHHSGVSLAPVSVFTEQGREPAICNLAFDRLPPTKSLIKTLTRSFAGSMDSITPPRDPLVATCDAVTRRIVDSVSSGGEVLAPLRTQLEAQGLDHLGKALALFDLDPTPEHALRALYLADRLADHAH